MAKPVNPVYGPRSDPNYMSNYKKKALASSLTDEYNRKYQKEYFKKYPERYTYWQIKGRCDRQNIPFNLEQEDIVYPAVCPILGIPLYRNVGGNKPTGNSPSVDRIDPKGGYVKGNIQIISQRANIMKNDASKEELLKFANWVIKTYG